MIFNVILKWSIWLFIGITSLLWAAESPVLTDTDIIFPESGNKYLLELPVDGYGVKAKEVAFGRALRAVLEGTVGEDNHAAIEADMVKPSQYVKQFSYVKKENQESSRLFLRVRLDAELVNKLLPSETVSFREEQPVEVLLWLANNLHTRRILNCDEVGVELILDRAKALGLTAMLPLGDCQELAAISAMALRQLDLTKIRSCSDRYGIAVVLAGFNRKSPGNHTWSGSYLLLKGSEVIQFSFYGNSEQELIDQALVELSKRVLEQTVAQLSQELIRLVLKVTGIAVLGQQEQLVQQLKRASVIRSATVVGLSGNEVDLMVEIIGGETALINVLSEQSNLVPVVGQPPVGVDLVYRWI